MGDRREACQGLNELKDWSDGSRVATGVSKRMEM